MLSSLKKLNGYVKRMPRVTRQTTLHDLHSSDQFRRLLERERARTDRTGDEFSLLVLTIHPRTVKKAALASLIQMLRNRLRITDELGWLRRRQLGVLLPSTPGWGAWKVADDVCQNLPKGIAKLSCTVYCYPSDWPHHPECQQPAGDHQRQIEKPVQAMDMLFVQGMPLWKRTFDVMGASIALALLLPLLAVVAAGIKILSPGPVFFSQMRSGLGGRPFRMWKFRTMVVDAEAKQRGLLAMNEQDGPAFKIKNDPRVTRFGWLLRVTSIDELPQIWNVLKGDMSLVGPRPLPCHESAECRGWLRRRLDVTPGLTCIWQVRGRSCVSFADWVRMDVQYIRSRSLRSDLKLILQTVPALVLRRGC